MILIYLDLDEIIEIIQKMISNEDQDHSSKNDFNQDQDRPK